MFATDMAWVKGNGPEPRGTGEAILMAIAGRRQAVHDLTGPGVAILQERFDATEPRAAATAA